LPQTGYSVLTNKTPVLIKCLKRYFIVSRKLIVFCALPYDLVDWLLLPAGTLIIVFYVVLKKKSKKVAGK
jgi:hypothetical protein